MEPLSLAATVIPLTLAAVSDPTYPPSPLFDTGSLSSEYMKNFYLVPWTRFQPYIIGLILGSVFYRLKGQNKTSLELSGVVVLFCADPFYSYRYQVIIRSKTIRSGSTNRNGLP